jgi:hypothetical protein
MANLHNLINKYHGTWKFVDINEASFINMTNYDYRILNEKNPYLKECKDLVYDVYSRIWEYNRGTIGRELGI